MSSHAEFSPYKNVEVTSSCDACMWLGNYLNLFSPYPLTSISELFNYMITHHIIYLVDCLWYMSLKTECLYVLRFSPAKKFIRQSHIVYLNKLMMQLIPFHGEGNGFNFIRSCRQRVSKIYILFAGIRHYFAKLTIFLCIYCHKLVYQLRSR